MTEATLMIQYEDGPVRASVVRSDGYPSHVGKMLQEHYQTIEQVEALIELGELYSLGERLAPNEGEAHTFDNPAKGVTIAFVRDRGVPSKGFPKLYNNINEANWLWGNTDYFYVFDAKTEKWKGNKSSAFYHALFETDDEQEIFPLEELIAND